MSCICAKAICTAHNDFSGQHNFEMSAPQVDVCPAIIYHEAMFCTVAVYTTTLAPHERSLYNIIIRIAQDIFVLMCVCVCVVVVRYGMLAFFLLAVKVGSSVCPWHLQVSPSWYQLVAIKRSNGGGDEESEDGKDGDSPTGHTGMNKTDGSMREGVFLPMKSNQEIHHCDFNKVDLSNSQCLMYKMKQQRYEASVPVLQLSLECTN